MHFKIRQTKTKTINCDIIAQFENDFPLIASAVGGFCAVIAQNKKST